MNRPYRIIITGSRSWADAEVVRARLDAHADLAVQRGAPSLTVVHGACYPDPDPATGRLPAISADWLVHLWATVLPHPLPVAAEPHPADWTAPCQAVCRPGHRRVRRGRSTCPAAGVLRNQHMVDLGADAAEAFVLNGSRGTRDCVRRLRAAGIPVDPVTRTIPADAGSPTTARRHP